MSSSPSDGNLWVTILAGGIGSRFWPLSTRLRPKQLLALRSGRSLLEDTLARASALAGPERVRILAGRHLEGAIREMFPTLPDRALMIEPQAKGTAPVLTWAAWSLLRDDRDAIMISLHADHFVEPPEALPPLLRSAAGIACSEDVLVTVAAAPDRPETGYGYIQPGSSIETHPPVDAFHVSAFVEKPDPTTAREYVRRGCLWNTGMFVWTASRFLKEVAQSAPEIGDLLPLLDQGRVEEFFARCPEGTVDVLVLERSDRVAAVRAPFAWDDVGNWESLSRVIETDERGNALLGEVYVVDGSGNVAYSDSGPLVLFGVQDLVAVRTARTTLVTHRSRAAGLKELLQCLPSHIVAPENEK